MQSLANSLSKFRGIHDGASCYLIGDGASLKWFDLQQFSNHRSFALCYVNFHKEFTALDACYNTIHSPFYFWPYYRLPFPPYSWWENRINPMMKKAIRERNDIEFFINLSNFPFLREPNVNFVYQDIPEFDFAEECKIAGEHIFDGCLRTGVTLALFMGFKEIILVGCDYTLDSGLGHHWYEHGEGKVLRHANYNKTFFDLAQKHADFITISRFGGSSIMPSREYSKFTGKRLIYRENTELLSEEQLSILNSWPDYKIYND